MRRRSTSRGGEGRNTNLSMLDLIRVINLHIIIIIIIIIIQIPQLLSLLLIRDMCRQHIPHYTRGSRGKNAGMI